MMAEMKRQKSQDGWRCPSCWLTDTITMRTEWVRQGQLKSTDLRNKQKQSRPIGDITDESQHHLERPDVELDIEFQRHKQDSAGRVGRASSHVCPVLLFSQEPNTSLVINNQEKVAAGLDPNQCRVRADQLAPEPLSQPFSNNSSLPIRLPRSTSISIIQGYVVGGEKTPQLVYEIFFLTPC